LFPAVSRLQLAFAKSPNSYRYTEPHGHSDTQCDRCTGIQKSLPNDDRDARKRNAALRCAERVQGGSLPAAFRLQDSSASLLFPLALFDEGGACWKNRRERKKEAAKDWSEIG